MLLLVSVSFLFVITNLYNDSSISTICNQSNWHVHSTRTKVKLSNWHVHRSDSESKLQHPRAEGCDLAVACQSIMVQITATATSAHTRKHT